jgi:Uma2 family endonuclease
MQAISLLHKYSSLSEYLALEAVSLIKHEYHNGKIIAIAGGTPRHSLLKVNFVSEAKNALKGKNCLTYDSDLQVAINRNRFVYPDATIVCGKLEFFEDNPLAVKNPVVIVEVLSENNADYDTGKKMLFYLQIPSLQEYVLVSQTEPFVRVFTKNDQGKWLLSLYNELSQTIELLSVGIKIKMSDLYENIIFEEEEV